MALIRFFLLKPPLVGAVVAFLIIAGLWSLVRIPIQLTPDVQTPQLRVQTSWPGASPYEVEKEIVIKQEDVLKNIPNLERISSESVSGGGRINLEFAIGTDLDDAILRVSNELDQVTGYPENAMRPRVVTSGSNSSPVMWIQLRTIQGNPTEISQYYQYVVDEIVPEFEKIPGIAEAQVRGGSGREVKILVDTEKLAAYQIGLGQLIQTIRRENVDISGGSIDEGKRRYVVRTLSKFRDIKDLGNLIIKKSNGQKVYLRDLAEVEIGFKDATVKVMQNGEPSMVIPIYREQGSNVLEVTEKGIALIERLNQTKLKSQKLELKRLSDQLYYIENAISLVTSNLFLGSFLAFGVLLLFLGNFRSALVIIFSIPVSVVGTFVLLQAFGRNINVVSLAGLAFAVGMVVDSAIVVLENIDQYRLKGIDLFDAALKATHEVWGAILASSLTTVAVFLPVLFVEEKAGQLFADISIAICSSILLALAVAVIVIPTLYKWLLSGTKVMTLEEVLKSDTKYAQLRHYAGDVVETWLGWLRWILRSVKRKAAFLGGTLLLSAILVYLLAPKLEYLPGGNRNLIFGILIPPSGYNTDEIERIGKSLMEDLMPAIEGKIEGIPQIERVFYVGVNTRLFMGVIAKDPEEAKELLPFVKKVLTKVPGMFAITSQSSLFERGLSAGRSIDIEIHGDDLEEIAQIGQQLFGKTKGILPKAQVRPIPSLEIGTPEIQVQINSERAAEMGLSTEELGLIVDVYTDGRKIDEFTDEGGDILDITLASRDIRVKSISDFSSLSLITPNRERIPIASVARIVETVGPNQIDRIDQSRVITLRVSPPDDMSLEEALDLIEQKIVAPANQTFAQVSGFRIELSGTADDFTKTRKALQGGFLAALGITFLLLVVLFEDFLAPIVIMASLPVAAAGGMILLAFVNLALAPQSLDVLVMLGFLMLIGIVVNNPILIVHRALYLIRSEGMHITEATLEAVRNRVRPIFMSTMTSVLGLMPLVMIPGAGSELYRGLGSAVLGGLLLSTFVSIFFVPVLFSFIDDIKKAHRLIPLPLVLIGSKSKNTISPVKEGEKEYNNLVKPSDVDEQAAQDQGQSIEKQKKEDQV